MKRGIRGLVEVGLLSMIPLVSGCGSMLSGVSVDVGGYKHIDMSRSKYSHEIRSKADELAKKPDRSVEDSKIAGGLYGNLGELDRMDELLIERFRRDPRGGLIDLRIGDKVHEFYGNKKDK